MRFEREEDGILLFGFIILVFIFSFILLNPAKAGAPSETPSRRYIPGPVTITGNLTVTGGTISGSGTGITGITAGDLSPGSSNYIQHRATLQTGSTFYVTSGTASNLNVPSAFSASLSSFKAETPFDLFEVSYPTATAPVERGRLVYDSGNHRLCLSTGSVAGSWACGGFDGGL